MTGAVHAANITVKGSDTMVILGQKWAEVYMMTRPGTTVQVTGAELREHIRFCRGQESRVLNWAGIRDGFRHGRAPRVGTRE